MNRNSKAREIEARLHRSLVNQVRAPQLDRRFDAGVWARIEAEERAPTLAMQPSARKSTAARWLAASNWTGLAVAAVLVVVFGLRMFSGDVGISMPEVSVAQNRQLADLIIWSVTGATLVFGLMFTPLGRWLRAEFT